MAARSSLASALALSIVFAGAASAAPVNDAANPFLIKPPDPFKQDALPLPPMPSPKSEAATPAPGFMPAKPPPGHPQLTENDAYAAYQRGYFIEAFALSTELAGGGDPQAMTMLGQLYNTGQGVRQDFPRAAQWFQLGATRGDREAQVALALMYLGGTGVKADKAHARDLFEAAAKQNQPTALFNLAMLTMEGIVLHPDGKSARDLMRRAAELGSAEAQYSYALMLDDDPTAKQDQEITYWMGLAARAGHVPAELEYGIRLAKGRGTPPDLDTAVLFLNRAAWAGNAIAQNRIAHLIAVGEGMPFSDIEAVKWHLLAKAGGVQDPQLEDLMATLKPADLAKAQSEAANWPSPPSQPTPLPLSPPTKSMPKFDLRGPLDVDQLDPRVPSGTAAR